MLRSIDLEAAVDVTELVSELHRLVEAHPLDHSVGYTEAIRTLGAQYARACLDRGERWCDLAKRVPMSQASLRNWLAATEGRPGTALAPPLAAVPVVVEPTVEELPSRRPVIVSPGGYRLEGLGLEDAVLALRALG